MCIRNYNHIDNLLYIDIYIYIEIIVSKFDNFEFSDVHTQPGIGFLVL